METHPIQNFCYQNKSLGRKQTVCFDSWKESQQKGGEGQEFDEKIPERSESKVEKSKGWYRWYSWYLCITVHMESVVECCYIYIYYINLYYIYIYIYRVCAWCWMHIGVFDAAVPGLPKGRRVGQFRATHHGETATAAFAQLECPVWAWSVERVECRNEKTWDNYMNFMDQFCIIHDNSW